MVKFLVFVYLFFSSFCLAFTQIENLVPNPSFEEHTCCPCDQGKVDCSNYWFRFTSSPDYYNKCNNDTFNCNFPNGCINCYGVPLNGAGFSSAKDGNAMFGAGIILGPGSTNIGESFGVKLLEKLKENVVYCYSFWVKLADSSNYTGYDANIGFYDNENAYYNDPNTNFHYVKNNNKTLFNTLEWVEIAGSFLANGNESYLIVGNFNSPDTTFATPTGMTTSMTGAYVYFDLISIYNCDSTFLPEAPNVITANGDGFNDFWTLNDYNKAVGTIEIYNRWGNLVYKRKESEPIIWDPANISSGVYFYIIQSKNDITKQKRGTITVLGGP